MASLSNKSKIAKALYDAAKSTVKRYKDKRDPQLLTQKINPKATYGTDEARKSVKEIKKYGAAKALTAAALATAASETGAYQKVWDGVKYVYKAVTEKQTRDSAKPGAKTTAKPAASKSNDYKTKAAKVTTARKEQVAANKQKVKANTQMVKATTNKEKVAANKTKVAANARMVAANKKKVAANTARYK